TLQLRYWETFVDDYDPNAFTPDDLYRLPRLNSLSRSRATIQNKLKLFQATAAVRERRGTMSDEERERAVREAAYPVLAIYADESGKTQDHIVVGSLWVLRSEETLRLMKAFGMARRPQLRRRAALHEHQRRQHRAIHGSRGRRGGTRGGSWIQ